MSDGSICLGTTNIHIICSTSYTACSKTRMHFGDSQPVSCGLSTDNTKPRQTIQSAKKDNTKPQKDCTKPRNIRQRHKALDNKPKNIRQKS